MGTGIFFLLFWNSPDIFEIPASLLYSAPFLDGCFLPPLLLLFSFALSAATTFSTSRLIVALSLSSSLRRFFSSACTFFFSFSSPAIMLFCSFSSFCIFARSVSCSLSEAFLSVRAFSSSSRFICNSPCFSSNSPILFFRLSASSLWAFI